MLYIRTTDLTENTKTHKNKDQKSQQFFFSHKNWKFKTDSKVTKPSLLKAINFIQNVQPINNTCAFEKTNKNK